MKTKCKKTKCSFVDENLKTNSELKWTIYMKQGCPFCQKVLDNIKNNDLGRKIEICYVDKDFTYTAFKKLYGSDSTFPRGYLHKDGTITFIGGSDEILNSLETHS